MPARYEFDEYGNSIKIASLPNSPKSLSSESTCTPPPPLNLKHLNFETTSTKLLSQQINAAQTFSRATSTRQHRGKSTAQRECAPNNYGNSIIYNGSLYFYGNTIICVKAFLMGFP